MQSRASLGTASLLSSLLAAAAAGWVAPPTARAQDFLLGPANPDYGDGHAGATSAAVVSMEMARKPGFVLRVIVVPLMLLVMLSWSVFWMDRESLGDRMDLSFIGILTVVAFQTVVSDSLPLDLPADLFRAERPRRHLLSRVPLARWKQ